MKKILYEYFFWTYFTGCGNHNNEETENGTTETSTSRHRYATNEQTGNDGEKPIFDSILYKTRKFRT